MGRRLTINQDVVAGLMFLAFGALFLFFGRDYRVGTALRMGPGYMPMILGWSLVVVGAVIAGRGALLTGASLDRWALRPLLLVCGSFLAFAWLIEDFGLIVTAMATMLIAARGGLEFYWREQIVLAASAAAVATIGFIYFLNLPMLYLPRFLGTGY